MKEYETDFRVAAPEWNSCLGSRIVVSVHDVYVGFLKTYNSFCMRKSSERFQIHQKDNIRTQKEQMLSFVYNNFHIKFFKIIGNSFIVSIL